MFDVSAFVAVAASIGLGGLLKTALDAFVNRHKRRAEAVTYERGQRVATDTAEITNLRTVLDDLTERHTELSLKFDQLFDKTAKLQQDFLAAKRQAADAQFEIERLEDEVKQMRVERSDLQQMVAELGARVAQLEAELELAASRVGLYREWLRQYGIDPDSGKPIRRGSL